MNDYIKSVYQKLDSSMVLNFPKPLFLLLSTIFLFTTCEEPDKEDTTPPEVSITSPQNGSNVSEIVTITCMASDNEGVEKVELWVNGVTTGISDESEPYSMDWNTTSYDEGTIYNLIVRAYDINGNTKDSESISVLVDNSDYYPTKSVIYPINLQKTSFSETSIQISWSKNPDSDFSSYKLYESLSNDMSSSTLIHETTDQLDTATISTAISQGETKFYQLEVEDELGLKSTSDIDSVYCYAGIVFGGIGSDIGRSVKQTSDGGFIVLGSTNSTIMGDSDYWLIKTDINGTKEWENLSGLTGGDAGFDLQLTQDGGFIIVGYLDDASAGDVPAATKTDENGNVEWRSTFEGISTKSIDFLTSVKQTLDGSYIAVSYGGSLIRFDADGNTVWSRTFDFEEYGEEFSDLIQSSIYSTDGYIITGRTNYYKNGSSYDLWTVITDSQGNELKYWDLGASQDDVGVDIIATSDGGYLVLGNSGSKPLIYKKDSEDNEEYLRMFGAIMGAATDIAQTSDGGYVLVGGHYNAEEDNNSLFLMKVDSNGNEEWFRSFGKMSQWSTASSVDVTTDGGFIIAARRDQTGSGNLDLWLLYTDSDGNPIN